MLTLRPPGNKGHPILDGLVVELQDLANLFCHLRELGDLEINILQVGKELVVEDADLRVQVLQLPVSHDAVPILLNLVHELGEEGDAVLLSLRQISGGGAALFLGGLGGRGWLGWLLGALSLRGLQ